MLAKGFPHHYHGYCLVKVLWTAYVAELIHILSAETSNYMISPTLNHNHSPQKLISISSSFFSCIHIHQPPFPLFLLLPQWEISTRREISFVCTQTQLPPTKYIYTNKLRKALMSRSCISKDIICIWSRCRQLYAVSWCLDYIFV